MMKLDFRGKTAIVTGGSRGIGKAIAEALLNLNCSVIITSTGKTAHWRRKYRHCRHISVDFLDPDSTSRFLKGLSLMPKIDILVNNAGTHLPEPIFEIKDKNWVKLMRVNLYAPMLTMKYACRKMMPARCGRILNISSVAGIISKPGSCAYSASKSGLIGLTRAAALDMAPYNILINALCPGHTNTDMIANVLTQKQREDFRKMIPLGRFANPEEIAAFAVFLCSGLNSYITGQAVIVDGGVSIQ